MKITGILLTIIILHLSFTLTSQDLLLIDRSDDNKIVNDAVITIYSTDPTIIDLTKYFTMVNNTDKTLNLYLRKTVHTIADSTTDYFCFGPKCWPDTDTTDAPAILEPGEEDYSFASHVVHVRRFDMPPLPPGLTTITYTIFDNEAFSNPVEAKVTVNYHLSPVSIKETHQISVSVFPNPSCHELTIQTNDVVTGNVDLIIFNNNGSIVMEKRVHVENGNINIDVNHLDSGIYIALLMKEDEKFQPVKFVVSK